MLKLQLESNCLKLLFTVLKIFWGEIGVKYVFGRVKILLGFLKVALYPVFVLFSYKNTISNKNRVFRLFRIF